MPHRWSKSQTTRAPRVWSSRRLAAASRAIQRQFDAVPLFPDLVTDKTLQERISRIDARDDVSTKKLRQWQADTWRKARRILRALPEPQRAEFIQYWNAIKCPATGADMIAFLTLKKLYKP